MCLTIEQNLQEYCNEVLCLTIELTNEYDFVRKGISVKQCNMVETICK